MTKEQNNKQFNFFFYSFKIKIVLVIVYWNLFVIWNLGFRISVYG